MNQYGLIGYPLTHSFSKTYFEQKFVNENLHQHRFELFPIPEINEFEEIIISQKDLKGLAVTIPHKQTIMPLLSAISDEAKAIGAVNCVKVNEGKTIGFNTDVVGFEKSLKPLLQQQYNHALVLGTGGASKAVQYVLHKLSIPFLLVSRFNNKGSITYQQLNEKLFEENLLIINTTPVGMTPNEDECPNIPYQYLTKNHLLYDLIYKPAKTVFLQKGEQQGCVIKNGFEMLILQAEENWKIWNS